MVSLAAPPPVPDSDLVVRAQDGDRDALGELARRWWPTMRRWALLELREVGAAEDACQEALVRLVRFIGRCDAGKPLAPWLHAIVRNCCRDQGGHRKRLAERERPLTDRAVAPDLERRLDMQRGARWALAALGALTPRQRQVVDMCDRQGLAPSAAAEILDIAPSTVRALLTQGRHRLRERMLATRAELVDVLRE